MKVTLNRQLLGLEDMLFGAGTVEQIRGGQTVTITKINASNMPFGTGDETFIEVIEGYIVEAQEQAQIATDAANSITSLTVVGVPGLNADATYDTLTNTITFTLPQGEQGIPGPESTVPGPQGDSITAVTSSKVGKTTTVEVYVEDVLEDTFTIQDGSDGLGSGDMLKATYDSNDNGIVDAAETVPWSGVTDKPATYPPEAHTHDELYEPLNANIQTHLASTSNPHSVTKTQVGLSNVDNTSDANKPISTATQDALDDKSDTTHTHTAFNGLTITGLKETSVAMPANDINLATGNLFIKTISGLTTFTLSNVPTSGTVAYFLLELTNGGSSTVTWFSGVKWASAKAPTLTSAGVDLLRFVTRDGGTTWRGSVLDKDSK